MKSKLKAVGVLALTLLIVVGAICIGSVGLSPRDILLVLKEKGTGVPSGLPPIEVGILWNMRIPRVLLAFIVGALLSISGVVMQSILQNSLASSYTLGVSSGAALFVSLYITLGLPNLLGRYTWPLVGLLGGVVTVGLVVVFSARMDSRLGGQTIVLVGMVMSLFANALLTATMSLSRGALQQILNWQMGSFALKDWTFVGVLFPVLIVGLLILIGHSRELDNLTFGEDAALTVGVNVKRMKWILLFISAALTGCAVSLVGVIGFVDLVIPHIVRRLFGSSHGVVLPLSALLGGGFMVVADTVARTIISPSEIPIGAVTALIGAPFFVYMYFKGRAVE